MDHAGAFRRWEFQAGTVGTVNVAVEKDTKPEDIRVLDAQDRSLPFTIDGNNLRFFSGAPGTVRVRMGDRENVYSLTLPDVGEAVWRVPASVHKGVPRAVVADAAPRNLWPWLALLGGHRAAGRLAALRAQPGIPLTGLTCDGSSHTVEKSVMTTHRRWL